MSHRSTDPLACVAVDLSPADIPRIYAVYTRALAAVPDPAAVRADAPSFFEEMFAVGGEIIGFLDEGELVAYGVLRPELDSEHDRAGLDGLVAPGAMMRVLDGSAVCPAYWGRGVQRAVIETRISHAQTQGASDVIAKAAPRNVPSMRNLTKGGFRIVGRVMKPYGWRYVHHRPVAPCPAVPEAGEWARADDVDAAEARFRAGGFAFEARRDEAGEPILRFAKGLAPQSADSEAASVTA
ncbi:GNAT family N-acetyltransferase [Acuticoccus sp. M5D2P5]|uniref:GNAT family N-acetyltransferase n=1 Tax=Acuticoccus kalidii TaxID=2910977 RepID=UPI001F18287E|nr:GNAT family N-acetyltransferase [Acuticoccus kalidii]MCF3935672.1 GNAT family N-acetyltransferase [Acuticoccus kalidii]